jgi:hypothetical protein
MLLLLLLLPRLPQLRGLPGSNRCRCCALWGGRTGTVAPRSRGSDGAGRGALSAAPRKVKRKGVLGGGLVGIIDEGRLHNG